MKLNLLAVGVLSLLTGCADLPPLDGDQPTDSSQAKLGLNNLSAQGDAAYRNPNRANLEFTYDMMVYADKIEFTDSTHSTCNASGHVWLKCSHSIEGLEEMFGDKALINMFAQTLRMEGHPKALMTGKDSTQRREITASSGSTSLEVDRGEGGAFFKVNGPSRTETVTLPSAATDAPEKGR